MTKTILDRIHDKLDEASQIRFFDIVAAYASGEEARGIAGAPLIMAMLDTLIAGTPSRSRLAAAAWLQIRFP